MLVYDFLLLDTPFDQGSEWFRTTSTEVVARASDAIFGTDRSSGAVEHSPVRTSLDSLVLDLRWRRSTPPEPMCLLEGELRLSPLAPTGSHLSLRAHCQSPEEGRPTSAEWSREQRRVEARVRAFLAALGSALAQAVAAD